MNKIVGAGVILLLLLATGCVSTRTGAHFDQAHDFSAINSFYWVSDEPAVIPPDADRAAPQAPVRTAIVSILGQFPPQP